MFIQISSQAQAVFSGAASFLADFSSYASQTYTLLVRWVLAALGVIILLRCALPLLLCSGSKKPWGCLMDRSGTVIPLRHWENSIGRSRLSDIIVNLPFVSRSHAVISYSGGDFIISDLGAKGGVSVNGVKINGRSRVKWGDVISLGGYELTLYDSDPTLPHSAQSSGEKDAAPARFTGIRPVPTLILAVLFELLATVQEGLGSAKAVSCGLFAVMLVFIAAEIFHCVSLTVRGLRSELEMLAYYLCGIGLLVTASASPSSLVKELAAILIGIVCYVVFLHLISDLDRAAKMKIFMYSAAFVLMALNIVIGQTRNGAKNWISFAGLTFQPMELVKIAFVFAGTATLDRLLTRRNLSSYILFSGACIGTLAITKDFGTALVFFSTFLIMAFMRSGDIRTIALIIAGAALGAVAVISFFPYISARFSAWGHVWQHADSSGFQQTRTMIGIASGGLIGLGGGNGYLCKIAAAGTDLAFGVICEEWGLIIALTAALGITVFAVFSLLSARTCRSSFYAIAACGSSAIMLAQAALNIFGSVDILPLTGVTLPFISNGGTSILTCWCLLAYIRSADERPLPPRSRVPSGGENV